MLDHVGFAVSDIVRSRAFYQAALRPLGIDVIVEIPPEQNAEGGGGTAIGFGSGDNPFF